MYLMEQDWIQITTSAGYLFILLFLALILLSVYQLRKLSGLKKVLEASGVNNGKVADEQNDSDITADEDDDEDELKSQLRAKTFDLAKAAKEIKEKEEVFNRLRDSIMILRENPNGLERITREMLQIIEGVSQDPDGTFEMQIDDLNQQLYDKLKQNHPDLSANDLLLCAYIKMGFESKEIANMLHIKPSSVYINRSRLRKKLNLEPNDDLYTYLNNRI